MDMKQNPFSLYDFLGYFIPGAIFLYGILAVIGHVLPDVTPVDYITEFLSFEKRSEIYIPFILASYTVGHILSFISSIIVERFSIWSHGYPSKYLLGYDPLGYFNVKEKKIIRWILRSLVAIFLFPIVIFDLICGRFLGFRDLYARKLDQLLIDIVSHKWGLLLANSGVKAKKTYGNVHDFDFFRYGEHYALENAIHHIPKMHNYIALYGFLRTLTLISIIGFWCLVAHIMYMCIFSLMLSILLILGSSLFSFVLYMGFIKFYRRYTLEVMMAVSVSI
jgi:hypothetical protein